MLEDIISFVFIMVRTSVSVLFAAIASILLSGTLGQDDEQCRTPPAGWPRRPPQCCDIPFPLESMKRHFGNCVRQIGRPSSAVPTAKAVMDARFCIEECVYKGMGLLESGDSLNKEKLSQELKSGVAGNGGWEATMEDAINTCYKSSEQLESGESSTCSSTPHAFTHCVMRQLFLNCPADQWNGSAECNLVKERMQVCPNIPPPPPSPPNQRAGPPQQMDFRQ